MTEENVKLIIAEVCARLPYGLKFHFYPDKDSKRKEVIATATGYDGDYQCVETKTEGFNVRNIKLYLRPMSSMTEEELKELNDKYGRIAYFFIQKPPYYYGLQAQHEDIGSIEISEFSEIYVWLNAHHFDYRGLIEKGLALDLATLDND